MFPKYHIVFGLIFSFLLYLVFPSIGSVGFALIFLSSFLIDVDHYIYYIYKKRDWNLEKAYFWFVSLGKKFLSLSKNKREKYYISICFFHGVEVIFLSILFGFFITNLLYFLALGMLFHLFLDFISDYKTLGKFERFSVIYQINLANSKKRLEKIYI